MSMNELCKVETGAINPTDEIAEQCLEGVVRQYFRHEAEVADVKDAGVVVSEYGSTSGGHGACVSCNVFERRVNVGVMPGGTRIAVTGVRPAEPSELLPEVE